MSYSRTSDRRNYRERRSPTPRITKKYEEHAIVLDVIPADRNRRRDKYRGEPIIEALGQYWFTILEIIPEDENTIMLIIAIPRTIIAIGPNSGTTAVP